MSIIALVKLSRNVKQVWVFIFSDQDLTFVFFEISITSSAWKWKCQSILVVSRFNSVFFFNVKPKIGVKTIFCHISVFFFTEQNRFSLPHITTFYDFVRPFLFFTLVYIIFSRAKTKLFTLMIQGISSFDIFFSRPVYRFLNRTKENTQ